MSPDDIAKILDDLGQRLGPAGEAAFRAAVSYTYANALVAMLIAVATIVIGASVAVYTTPRADWNSEGPTRWDVLTIISWAAVIAGLLFIVFAGPDRISTLIAPEYKVIRDLMGR